LPGMREVMLKTNLKVDKQPYKKTEEKDVGDDINSDSEADTEYNEDEAVEMNIIDEDHRDVDVIDSDVIVIRIDFDAEYNGDVVETVEMQVHEKPEKRDGARRPCSQSSQPRSTTPATQSGTITPAVARYNSVPIVTLCVLKLTSKSLGVKVPGMREVMLKTNLKGKYDDNFDSEYDEDEVEEKQLHEKPEKKDVVADIISEGKYDDNYPVEDGREHLNKGDGFKTNLKGEHDEEKTVEKQLYEKPLRSMRWTW
jgi:hypothetical protein